MNFEHIRLVLGRLSPDLLLSQCRIERVTSWDMFIHMYTIEAQQIRYYCGNLKQAMSHAKGTFHKQLFILFHVSILHVPVSTHRPPNSLAAVVAEGLDPTRLRQAYRYRNIRTRAMKMSCPIKWPSQLQISRTPVEEVRVAVNALSRVMLLLLPEALLKSGNHLRVRMLEWEKLR